jgi:hypothetical protein
METDLMERRIGDLSLRDSSVTLHTKPYEIKTMKVQFSALDRMTATSKP